MGDPISMAVLSAGAQVATTGLKVAGNMGEGQSKKTAQQLEAVKMKMAAETAKVRAAQTDAAYREDLKGTLDNIDAIRSASGVRWDSPTGAALYEKAEENSFRARTVAVSNERLKALGLDADSAT